MTIHPHDLRSITRFDLEVMEYVCSVEGWSSSDMCFKWIAENNRWEMWHHDMEGGFSMVAYQCADCPQWYRADASLAGPPSGST